MKAYKNIDEYISNFPDEIQLKLQQMRELISRHAPGAQEAISYGIPTFKLNGNLLHFAAFREHLGFYPGASGIEAFADKLQGYHTSKGTVQFPLDKPLPAKLIREMVRYRVAQNQQKATKKK